MLDGCQKMPVEDRHKRQRFVVCRESVESYAQEGRRLVNSIVTDDETRVYRYTQHQRKNCPSIGDNPIAKASRVFNNSLKQQAGQPCMRPGT